MWLTVSNAFDKNGGDDGAKGRFLLVEAGGDFLSEREEGGDAGVSGSEAVLGRVAGEMGEERGADEAFKDFRGRAEEGNGAIGRA